MVKGHLAKAELLAAPHVFYRQSANKFDPCVALFDVGLFFELLARPERSTLGGDVKLTRLI